MLRVKCNQAMEHVPGSWPSAPTWFFLPLSPFISPGWCSVAAPPLSSSPHTSRSPHPLGWERRNEREPPPSPGLTAPCCIHLRGASFSPTPHPDPEHILALRFTNPWESPICGGLGRCPPLRHLARARWLAGAETATVWPPAPRPLGSWEGLPCTCPCGQGWGAWVGGGGLGGVPLFPLPPCLSGLTFALSGFLEVGDFPFIFIRCSDICI